MSGVVTRGVLFVHSSPRAVCLHVESVATNVLDADVSMDWTEQPAAPGQLRAEHSWMAPQGSGARLASALRGWEHLRFEVTEEPSRGSDGGRWSHTPTLGIFHAAMDVHGNTMVPEKLIDARVEITRFAMSGQRCFNRVLTNHFKRFQIIA